MKSRCKVIRHVMSQSVSEMPFLGVLDDFLWGRVLQTFGGALLNYTQTGYCVNV